MDGWQIWFCLPTFDRMVDLKILGTVVNAQSGWGTMANIKVSKSRDEKE